jgi:hypothetical protein
MSEIQKTGRARGLIAGALASGEEAALDEIPNPKAERPAMRPDMHESSSDRAARRAEEIRGHIGGMDEGTDEFYIPPDSIPDGWTYEWKRRSVMGQEDAAYLVSLRRLGWDPVPASRHPEMMPMGSVEQAIERKGMILMERPREITEEVKRLELRKAQAQVRQKQAQLGEAPAGQFERTNKGNPLAKIQKSYEPIVIPDE